LERRLPMRYMRNYLLLFCLILIPFLPAAAQEMVIKFGKSPVPIDEYFTITVTLKNQQLKAIGKFPDIEGFEKSNRFSATTTNIVNGQISTEQSITQNYAALKEGEYQIKPFSIEVNGKKAESKGGTVKVVASAGQPKGGAALPPLQGFGLLDDLFGNQKPQEYIDKKEDAFLAFSASKDQVYVGEGVSVNLSFYVASQDQNLLDFHDFNRQITPIIKKLKPTSVWEENFELTGEPEAISIDEKGYLRFKLYEAVYYPINTDQLLFPSVGLEMIKYKIAKDPSFLGDNRMATTKMYYTAPKIVKVVPLPPHPLRESVPVGNYQLKEGVDRQVFTAGKSFNFLFQVEGEGNLAAIPNPVPAPVAGLEFSEPDIRQNITRQNGRVLGQKSFRFFVTPKNPGSYDFSKIFSFIFFNPATAKYDTLRSDLKVTVTGQVDNDAAIQSKDMGEFYEKIKDESNTLQNLNRFSEVKLYTNLVVLLLLLVSIYLFYRHKL
jgi:hypothetical protein